LLAQNGAAVYACINKIRNKFLVNVMSVSIPASGTNELGVNYAGRRKTLLKLVNHLLGRSVGATSLVNLSAVAGAWFVFAWIFKHENLLQKIIFL